MSAVLRSVVSSENRSSMTQVSMLRSLVLSVLICFYQTVSEC